MPPMRAAAAFSPSRSSYRNAVHTYRRRRRLILDSHTPRGQGHGHGAGAQEDRRRYQGEKPRPAAGGRPSRELWVLPSIPLLGTAGKQAGHADFRKRRAKVGKRVAPSDSHTDTSFRSKRIAMPEQVSLAPRPRRYPVSSFLFATAHGCWSRLRFLWSAVRAARARRSDRVPGPRAAAAPVAEPPLRR